MTALRAERGWSLSELARRASLGKATLSGLEAGTRNPTLDTLHSVAAAFELPLTAILAMPPTELVHGVAVEMSLLRVFDDGPVTYELFRMRIPAGSAQRSPSHHAGVTEHATVFEGVLEAGPIDRIHRAGPGDYVEWAANEPHRYAAVGASDVVASLLIRYPAMLTRRIRRDRPGPSRLRSSGDPLSTASAIAVTPLSEVRMSQPTPSPKPEQDSVEEPELDDAGTEAAAEAEVPLNRAARRAKAKGGSPSHVGPQAGRSDQSRGPRSHTKRQIS